MENKRGKLDVERPGPTGYDMAMEREDGTVYYGVYVWYLKADRMSIVVQIWPVEHQINRIRSALVDPTPNL